MVLKSLIGTISLIIFLNLSMYLYYFLSFNNTIIYYIENGFVLIRYIHVYVSNIFRGVYFKWKI